MNATKISNVLTRLMNGMSESKLAEKVRVPKATINRILSGRTPNPRVSTIATLAQYFDVSIDQLIGIRPLEQDYHHGKYSALPTTFYNIPKMDYEQLSHTGISEENYFSDRCAVTTTESSFFSEQFISSSEELRQVPYKYHCRSDDSIKN